MTAKPPLPALSARFVEEFMASDNAVEALRATGWRPTKGGDQEAKMAKRASVLMRDRRVQDAILAAKLERRERLEATAELTEQRTLRELRALMYSDVRQLFTPSGFLKGVGEFDEDTARAISGVKIRRLVAQKDAEPEEVVEIKFWDKNSALEKGMKYLGMFERDNAQRPAAVLVPMTPERTRAMLEQVRAERAKREAARGKRK